MREGFKKSLLEKGPAESSYRATPLVSVMVRGCIGSPRRSEDNVDVFQRGSTHQIGRYRAIEVLGRKVASQKARGVSWGL